MMENKIIWQDRKHFMWFPISFTKYEIKMIAYIKRLAYLVLTMTNCFCIVLPIYVYEEIYHKNLWYWNSNFVH